MATENTGGETTRAPSDGAGPKPGMIAAMNAATIASAAAAASAPVSQVGSGGALPTGVPAGPPSPTPPGASWSMGQAVGAGAGCPVSITYARPVATAGEGTTAPADSPPSSTVAPAG